MPPNDQTSSGDDSRNPWQNEREDGPKAWGILLFALIGATATTYAVGQMRRTVDFVWSQSTPFSSWKNTGSSGNGGFRAEAWKRYNRRLQEEYEEEMERVERIRRMQSVFNRERNKFKKGYESWREHGANGYHQHFQREDWYWKTDPSFKDQRDQRANSRAHPSHSPSHSLSHHYSVLGLDRSRTTPYTDKEIKTAFRAKAMEYHPDQNQNNKEAAEAKFKQVLTSYEAIKLQRKNERH
ncbi:chaperone DnaJ-domain superfamily protein isoform X2 [Wolffia australiana]